MTPIFRWNGRYFGFVTNGYLFDAAGTYRGWVTADGQVWRADGRYVGDLVEGGYVLKSAMATRPADRPPPPKPPAPPAAPDPPKDRLARLPLVGYGDALDMF